MVFPIVGGSQQVATYDIANSLRFNDDDDPQLSLSTGTTNKRKFTVSLWAKRSTNGNRQSLWASDKTTNDTGDGSKGGSGIALQFWNDDMFYFGGFGGNFQVRANGLQRDNAAWYHIVGQVDTEQGTTNDRAKLWINGVQQTTYSAMIGQNTDVKFATNRIGRQSSTANYSDSDAFYYDNDGYIAELHVIDGQYYDASYFGETNDNGVWVPKEYTGSYGSDGYYLEFKQTGTSANASGIGADTSGNDKHFTVTNLAATDVTVDTPTNNFATMNPLSPTQGSPVYAEGNLKISISSTAYSYFPSTFGLSNGKWYVEVRVNSQGGNTFIGIAETSMEAYYTGADNDPHLTAGTIWYGHSGNGNYDGASQNSGTFGAASYTDGDIIGLALDLDSGTRTIKFYKNGSLTVSKDLTSNFVDPIVFAANLYNTQNQSWNFGNPPFSISSGNADANGYGNFEYAPPSGYYACCTKNLAEFG